MAPNEKSRLTPGHALRNLAHDNSSSLWRRSKSSANMREQAAQESTSLKVAPKLERTPSKMSLFNLFSKPKVERARGHTEVGLAVPIPPQESHKPLPSPPKSSLRKNPPPHTQQPQRMRTSQIFNPVSSRSSSFDRPTSMIEDDWQPLPLFQAYQQAIKHATVQACVFSPDVLLRTQSQRRQAELLRERSNNSRPDLDNIPEQKKLEKPNRRIMTNPMSGSSPQLTKKFYALIPSGYILQYASDGAPERLPEKVLRLGNESAAFACDLIPGKHWVLQISQSASEDGTVVTAPRHSIFSRLRMQGSSARKTATSFLLVMDSAEEMESWMTTVRREIENLGGIKVGDDSSRASSSTDDASEKMTTDMASSHHPVPRESDRISKINPVDSPLQSQYSDSPRIITSEWEGDRHEKRTSVADSSSVRSRYSNGRTSVEAPSIATTAASHDQLQLDQLRHSRHSYMSATSAPASGTATVNTSRDSSPASTSPLREKFAPADAEPLRSASSLKSFHMSTTRRRSMQPLPVTNEDTSLSAAPTSALHRHSTWTPTSHPSTPSSAPYLNSSAPASLTATRPASTARYSSTPAGRPAHNPNLIRYGNRSSSAPPARVSTTITPPPNRPVPAPPSATRPPSTLGNLPHPNTQSNHAERRVSATPKPFIRPFPVRPQSSTNKDGSIVVPRRFSSTVNSGPAPLPLGIVVNRAVTSPAQPPSRINTSPRQQSGPPNAFSNQQPVQQLRRPNSVQIRSSTAPFLSQSRPARAISNTPSFVPGKRASAAPTASTLPATPTLSSSPSIPVLRGQGQQLSPPKSVSPRRSVPNMGLPPPAPPPTMPLPLRPGEPQRAVPV